MTYDVSTKPTGLWSIRPQDLKDGRFQYPPGDYLVLNGSGRRISFVQAVDWDAERVLRCQTNTDEWGDEVVKVLVESTPAGDKKTVLTEWLDVPGVRAIPIPQGYRDEQKAKAERKKKRYAVSPDGAVTDQNTSSGETD